MKQKRVPKPKFRIGEVVVYPKPFSDDQDVYGRVKSVTWKRDCGSEEDRWCIRLHNGTCNHHSWFRKLNKKELVGK